MNTEYKYVLSFLFNQSLDEVWLIEKQKPEWQKGCLNGIGGKVEEGEDYHTAAVRELTEETSLSEDEIQLIHVGHMFGTNNDESSFRVEFFTGITDKYLSSGEEEVVMKVPVKMVKGFKHIENVPMIIEACKYMLSGNSHFSKLVMHY